MSNVGVVNVRQRLDALIYDENSNYVLGSVQGSQPYRQGQTTSTSHGVTVSTTRLPAHRNGCWRVLGITPFYARFVLLLGFTWFLQILTVITFLFTLPVLTQGMDLEEVNATKLPFAVMSYFLGQAIGAFVLGTTLDQIGRRTCALISVCIITTLYYVSLISLDYYFVVLVRTGEGFGYGGLVSALLTYLVEFAPKQMRGRVLVLTLAFSTPSLMVSLLSQFALDFITWRGINATLAVLGTIYTYLLYKNLCESPRYLVAVGRTEEAMRQILDVEAAHGIDRQARVPVPTSLYNPPTRRDDQTDRNDHFVSAYSPDHEGYSTQESSRDSIHPFETQRETLPPIAEMAEADYTDTKPLIVPLCQRIQLLFEADQTKATVLLWLTALMAMSGIVGSVGSVATPGINPLSRMELLLITACSLPGFIVLAALVEFIGRKPTLLVALFSMSLFDIILGSLHVVSTHDGLVGTMCVNVFTAVIVYGALMVYMTENFNRIAARGLGISWTIGMTFIGACCVFFVIQFTPPGKGHDESVAQSGLSLTISGSVLLLATVIAWLIGRETKNTDIDALPEENEATRGRSPWHPFNARQSSQGYAMEDTPVAVTASSIEASSVLPSQLQLPLARNRASSGASNSSDSSLISRDDDAVKTQYKESKQEKESFWSKLMARFRPKKARQVDSDTRVQQQKEETRKEMEGRREMAVPVVKEQRNKFRRHDTGDSSDDDEEGQLSFDSFTIVAPELGDEYAADAFDSDQEVRKYS